MGRKRILEVISIIALCCVTGLAQENDSLVVANAVLHYSVQGHGQPILLLSGGPGISSEQLADLSTRLSGKYRCILFDQRGTGKSRTTPLDTTTINVQQALHDIRLLLRQQRIERITIIGHSWGAMLATSYAIKHPDEVARLVLIGPGPLDLPGYEIMGDNIFSRASKAEKVFMNEAEDSIRHRTASPELMRAYDRTFLRFLFYDALMVDSLRQKIKASTNPAMRQLMLQDLGRIKYDVKLGVSQLTIPLMVICGREDPVGVFPAFLVRDLNRKARIRWIEKSGHFPWVEQPETFYRELFDFLK